MEKYLILVILHGTKVYTMHERTLIEQLSISVVAYNACCNSENLEYIDKWNVMIDRCAKELPQGSGFLDANIEIGTMTDKKCLINGSYHVMTEYGYYCGYLDFTVHVIATFTGINVDIELINLDDFDINNEDIEGALYGIEDYITDAYYEALINPYKGKRLNEE